MEMLSLSCEMVIVNECILCGKGATKITPTHNEDSQENLNKDDTAKNNIKNNKEDGNENICGKNNKKNIKNNDKDKNKGEETIDKKNNLYNGVEGNDGKSTDNFAKHRNNLHPENVDFNILSTKHPTNVGNNKTFLDLHNDDDITNDGVVGDHIEKCDEEFHDEGGVGAIGDTTTVGEDGNEGNCDVAMKCADESIDVTNNEAVIHNIMNSKNGINNNKNNITKTKNIKTPTNLQTTNTAHNKNNNSPKAPLVLKDNITITETTQVSDLLNLCSRHFSIRNLSNASGFFRINSWSTSISTRDIKTDSAMQALNGLSPHITYVVRLCVCCEGLKNTTRHNGYGGINDVRVGDGEGIMGELCGERLNGGDVSTDDGGGDTLNDGGDNRSKDDGVLSDEGGSVSNEDDNINAVLHTRINQSSGRDCVKGTRTNINDNLHHMVNGGLARKDASTNTHGKRFGKDLAGYEGERKRICLNGVEDGGYKSENDTRSNASLGFERYGLNVKKKKGGEDGERLEEDEDSERLEDDEDGERLKDDGGGERLEDDGDGGKKKTISCMETENTDFVDNKSNDQIEAYDLSLKNLSRASVASCKKTWVEADEMETKAPKPKSPKHLIEKNIINIDVGRSSSESLKQTQKFLPNSSLPEFWSPFKYWLLLYNTLKQNSQLAAEQMCKQHSSFVETSRIMNGVSNNEKKQNLENSLSDSFSNSFETKACDLSKNDISKNFNVVDHNQSLCRNFENNFFKNEKKKLDLIPQRESVQRNNSDHNNNKDSFAKDVAADYVDKNLEESIKDVGVTSYDDINVFENNFSSSFPCSTHLFVQRLIKQQSNLQQNYPVISQKTFTTPQQNNNQLPKTPQQAYKKRSRIFIDPLTEIPKLEGWFSDQSHPSIFMIERFTNELNSSSYRQRFPKLEPKNLQLWFKNHRAKVKRLQENRPHVTQ